ncbi:MAG: type II toxin-antitoxin system RelE/ParE family toxin [Sideroxyarcus sp.]|nr:type II toxin-antitoxin system RelE/ParE family toxin [Sideroxyarcus sp.]
MKIVVHPAATAELDKAAAFYSAQANKQLGLALIAEFEKSALFLSENTELGVPWVSGTRRFVMRRFPFNIVYYIWPDQLFVIAIAHQKRRPGYWHRRK